ncbi:aminotransferase class I/II-fold pyridoxal phosphate-dependent enzyme, partial [Candidatus Woesearchaeota archaeon]|nr:aminotransferase class I/II-fold pyridoxal phosphate-dependent enzyme [Candidatus Woesearchaeota archaeon]
LFCLEVGGLQRILIPDQDLVQRILQKNPITSLRTIKTVERQIAGGMRERGKKFEPSNMGFGNPGLMAPKSLLNDYARLAKQLPPGYDDFQGNLELRIAGAEHFRIFFGLREADAEHVYATAGTMEMNHIMIDILAYLHNKGKAPVLLFLEPGYAEIPDQVADLGMEGVLKPISWKDCRGENIEKLRDIFKKLRGEFPDREIFFHWSTLGNPVPVSFTEEEYKALWEICNTYDVIVFEDYAYPMAEGYYRFGGPTFPSAGKYMKYAAVSLSFSKSLSEARDRLSITMITPELKERLKRYRGVDELTIRNRHIITHPSVPIQIATARFLKRINKGRFNMQRYLKPYHVYGEKVYHAFSKDGLKWAMTNPDGTLPKIFYLPMTREDFASGYELVAALMRFGIITVPLEVFSSTEETRIHGVRITVSGAMLDPKTGRDRYKPLERRLEYFVEQYGSRAA